MYILKLEVHRVYKKNGIGTFLLIILSHITSKKYIELQDYSFNYGKENNIYINIGFRYKNKNKYSGHYMRANCKDVINNWEKFKNKYVNKRNFFISSDL